MELRARLTSLIRPTFANQLLVNLARMVVGFLRLSHFGRCNKARFLAPTLIDSLERPLRASTRSANRLTIDDYENGIRMGGANHASRHPTAFRDANLNLNPPPLP